MSQSDCSGKTLKLWPVFVDHYKDYFRERWYQYARLGLKAIIQVRRLRKMAGFPDTRLAISEWSAQPVLKEMWRIERRRRAKTSLEYRAQCEDQDYPESMTL